MDMKCPRCTSVSMIHWCKCEYHLLCPDCAQLFEELFGDNDPNWTAHIIKFISDNPTSKVDRAF